MKQHGTEATYNNHGCRCEKCRDAIASGALRRRAWRRRKLDIPHGTINGYNNYGCRCRHCQKAQRLYFAGRQKV